MKKLKGLKEDIYNILKEIPETRGDDMLLYWVYVSRHNGVARSATQFMGLCFCRPNLRNANGIAPYDTVSRARRLLQRRYKELQPSQEALERRAERAREWRRVAREWERGEDL